MKPRSTQPRPSRKSTEPDDAALRLQETEELLALAQEAGRIGIFEWQVQIGVVRLSPRFLSLYGLTEFDGRYETWLKCIFREDVRRITDLFDTAFAAQEREMQSEFRIVSPSDGKLKWMEARNNLFYDADGRPVRVVGVCGFGGKSSVVSGPHASMSSWSALCSSRTMDGDWVAAEAAVSARCLCASRR